MNFPHKFTHFTCVSKYFVDSLINCMPCTVNVALLTSFQIWQMSDYFLIWFSLVMQNVYFFEPATFAAIYRRTQQNFRIIRSKVYLHIENNHTNIYFFYIYIIKFCFWTSLTKFFLHLFLDITLKIMNESNPTRSYKFSDL